MINPEELGISPIDMLLKAVAPVKEPVAADKTKDAAEFLKAFREKARGYFRETEKRFQRDFPNLRVDSLEKRVVNAQIIERLYNEWQLVRPILEHLDPSLTFQNQFDKELAGHVDKIRNHAKEIFVSPNRVEQEKRSAVLKGIKLDLIPTFGTRFYVMRARYSPTHSVLSIPIYALSYTDTNKMIWHELAGLIVNPDNDPPLPTSGTPSYLPHEIFPMFTALGSDAICAPIEFPETSVDKDYPSFKDMTFNPAHLGWDRFWMFWADKMNPRIVNLELHALPKKADFPDKKDYLIDWRKAHLEELVEDACSTLIFGADIYDTLVTVLTIHYLDQYHKPDMRHPAPILRLEVTYQLLRCMGEALPAPDNPNKIDPIAHLHGNIPGAKELAAWIYANSKYLIDQNINLSEKRQQLQKLGYDYEDQVKKEALFNEPITQSPIADTAFDDKMTLDEIELLLFARIDPGAGSSPATPTFTGIFTSLVNTVRTWVVK